MHLLNLRARVRFIIIDILTINLPLMTQAKKFIWRIGRIGPKLDLLIMLPLLALLACIYAAAIYQIMQERQTAIKEVQAKSQELARALAERSTRILHQADHVSQLFKLAYEASSPGNRLTIAQFTRKNGAMNSALPNDLDLHISLINENGNMIDSTQPFTSVNLASQAFFKDHVKRNIDSLLIAKPFLDASRKKWAIQLSRRLNLPDGSFVGIVTVAIDPSFFLENDHTIELGKHDISIFNSPSEQRSIWRTGGQIYMSQQLDLALLHPPQARTEGQAVPSQSDIDHITRIYGSRELVEFGIVAIVGLHVGEQLAPYYYRKDIIIWLTLIGSSLFAAGVIVFMKKSRALKSSLLANQQAQSHQGGPESIHDLIKQADSMLYLAKREGRNTWRAAELLPCSA